MLINGVKLLLITMAKIEDDVPADFRPEKADFRPERADFRPERTWGGTDKRTNKQTNKQSPPVFYRTSAPSGPLPKKRWKCNHNQFKQFITTIYVCFINTMRKMPQIRNWLSPDEHNDENLWKVTKFGIAMRFWLLTRDVTFVSSTVVNLSSFLSKWLTLLHRPTALHVK